MNYVLGIDIGASSGRHFLGWIEDNQLKIEEIHRFENYLIEKDGHFCWDIKHLEESVLAGIKKCKELGKIPSSIGIDTWAVDFVLIDENGKRIGDAVGYRDGRTAGMYEQLQTLISKEALYAKTGSQYQTYNTIYQLMALKQQAPEQLEAADKLLMMPDYLHYLLTGVVSNEYTNASSTQLLDGKNKKWDRELLSLIGVKESLFSPLRMPGETLGELSREVQKVVGFNANVVIPTTHDTASAFVSVPNVGGQSVYISSGTWSLVGTEIMEMEGSEKARQYNFTNEGGFDYRYRFLKNVMGLWMISEVKKNYNNEYGFPVLVEMARECSSFKSIVDVFDERFLKPESMVKEIQAACKETNQAVPVSVGEVANCVFVSLATGYKQVIEAMEDVLGTTYEKINMVGGGIQNEYLNELTAQITGKAVEAGPIEATVIGNIVTQMIGNKEIANLEEARQIIRQSFEMKKYK